MNDLLFEVTKGVGPTVDAVHSPAPLGSEAEDKKKKNLLGFEVEKGNSCHNESDGKFCSGTDKALHVGREGEVSGSLKDKKGNEYIVFHTSKSKDDEVKHNFKVYQKDGFSIEQARRGNATGVVAQGETKWNNKALMDIQVLPEHQRKGVATALYDHIEDLFGYSLKPNTQQTDDGIAFWNSRKTKLSKAGRGVMVAWFPPAELAEKLAIDKEGYEPTDQLHVTLAYFGKDLDEDTIGDIREELRNIARMYAKLPGELGGIGRFPATVSSDNKDVVVLLADVPYMESLRQRLMDELLAIGIEPLRNHGYCPHMTLAYVDPADETPKVEGDRIPIEVGYLTLAIGGEHEVFELVGTEVSKGNSCHDGKGKFCSGAARVRLAQTTQNSKFGTKDISVSKELPGIATLYGGVKAQFGFYKNGKFYSPAEGSKAGVHDQLAQAMGYRDTVAAQSKGLVRYNLDREYAVISYNPKASGDAKQLLRLMDEKVNPKELVVHLDLGRNNFAEKTYFSISDARSGIARDPRFQVTKGNPCHSSSDGKFCSVVGGGSIKTKSVKGRAFAGEQIETKNKLSKLETGALGEKIVTSWLQGQGLKDARTLNVKVNNFPVDLIQDHKAYEVKTGLVSNRTDAQKWRATIGQPGKMESAWLKKASPEDKKAWNDRKRSEILKRKEAAVKKLGTKSGKKVKGGTITLIINPDTKKADIHKFDGFHISIPWKSAQAKAGYVGTVSYE